MSGVDNSGIDHRLVNIVACALCWAEFGSHHHRQLDEGPEEYWSKMSDMARSKFYADAIRIAQFMSCEARSMLLPMDATPEMIAAARVVRPALCRDNHVEDVWSAMISHAPKLRQPIEHVR